MRRRSRRRSQRAAEAGGRGIGGGGPGGGHPPVDLSGPHLGQLSIDLASGAVTFMTQPQALVLAGSAVYDAGAGTVVLSLYDPAAGSWSAPEGVADAFGVDFTAEAHCVYDFAAHADVCFALADDAALLAEATGAAAIPAAGGDFGHGVVVTRE